MLSAHASNIATIVCFAGALFGGYANHKYTMRPTSGGTYDEIPTDDFRAADSVLSAADDTASTAKS